MAISETCPAGFQAIEPDARRTVAESPDRMTVLLRAVARRRPADLDPRDGALRALAARVDAREGAG